MPIGIRIVRRIGFMQEPQRTRTRTPAKPNRVRDLIMQLPEDQRIKHFQRFQVAGLI
jgi:hypothetical protein